MNIGDRFTVKPDADQHFEIYEDGRLLVRFLPGFSYTVTPKNIETVRVMLAEGVIEPGGATLEERLRGVKIGATQGEARGFVTVKEK